MVTIVWVLLISANGVFSRIEPSAHSYGTWVIPVILLVVLHSQYTFSASQTAGLALALAASNIYVRASCRKWWTRLAIFVAASVLIYYVAGEAYYTFAGCCLVYELLAARRRVLGLSFLLAVPAVKFGIDGFLSHVNSAHLHFDVPEVLCLVPGSGMEEWIQTFLHVYFPACALFISLKPATFAMAKKLWHKSGRQDKAFRPTRMQRTRRWVLTPILLVVVAGVP